MLSRLFNGTRTTPNWTAESDQAVAQFGIRLASARCHAMVTPTHRRAYLYDNGQTMKDEHSSITAFNGLATTANWTAESDQQMHTSAIMWQVQEMSWRDSVSHRRAPLYDNGQTDEGRAFVYYGSAVLLQRLPVGQPRA